MARNIPVKPLSEVEVKENVSENDKILILDSETEEARLADKEELRWDSWVRFMTEEEYIELPEEEKMDWKSYFLWKSVANIVKVLLRPYNNLLQYNNDDELYADLQFKNWLTPVSVFPIWVTVWNVSANDWWQDDWLLLNARTENSYMRWLCWSNWKTYLDAWTWIFKEILTEATIDEKIEELRNSLSAVALSWKSSDLDNDAGFNSVPVLTPEEYENIPWTSSDDKRYLTYDTITE